MVKVQTVYSTVVQHVVGPILPARVPGVAQIATIVTYTNTPCRRPYTSTFTPAPGGVYGYV